MNIASDNNSFVGGACQSMGFFTWSVPENILFGDAIFSALYEMPEHALRKGIAVEQILTKILEHERPLMAKRIHEAIISGEPTSSAYRIRLFNGATRELVAFGRCIRDDTGIPSYFTGAVMDKSLPGVVSGDDALEAHCRFAHSLAMTTGNELAARYLSAALAILSPNNRPQ